MEVIQLFALTSTVVTFLIIYIGFLWVHGRGKPSKSNR